MLRKLCFPFFHKLISQSSVIYTEAGINDKSAHLSGSEQCGGVVGTTATLAIIVSSAIANSRSAFRRTTIPFKQKKSSLESYRHCSFDQLSMRKAETLIKKIAQCSQKGKQVLLCRLLSN